MNELWTACKSPHRLVVRTSRCGRDNPGSTPGVDILIQTCEQDARNITCDVQHDSTGSYRGLSPVTGLVHPSENWYKTHENIHGTSMDNIHKSIYIINTPGQDRTGDLQRVRLTS